MPTKFYAVKTGFKPGVYDNWSDCQKAVSGFPGAIFKSFKTKQEAQNFLNAPLKQTKDVSAIDLSQFDLLVYTDGGCRNHGNQLGQKVKATDKAAWGYLITDNQNHKLNDGTDGEFGATNNQMEMTAVIRALQHLVNRNYDLTNQKIAFICDSHYVTDGINLRMDDYVQKQFNGLKNANLWKELHWLLSQFNIQPEFLWTKGHSTNTGNNYVDALLNKTMDRL